LQSGYTFRTRSILREQRRMGWETFHVTSPKHAAPGPPEEEVDGLRFYRTPSASGMFGRIPLLRELALMRATTKRLEQVARLVQPDVLHAHSPALNAIPALTVGFPSPFFMMMLIAPATASAGGPPDFKLKDLDGNSFRLADHLGKLFSVVLAFKQTIDLVDGQFGVVLEHVPRDRVAFEAEATLRINDESLPVVFEPMQKLAAHQ